jgi:large subunit ribosomal protein L21
MFAVIKTGGKQYVVTPNQKLKVEKLEVQGEKIEFTDVLLVANDTDVKVGKPTVAGVKVVAKVLSQGKGKKINVIKYKSKSRYQIKKGHRQPFTELLIESIG